ncbi:hypothetical protein TNCV_952231 [Trichonephila clavipes]|nr:hypothetical protein TNCV_952231 [Trichonephila clavipes]
MAPHRHRKSAPTYLTTDDEDMITYDVEEEELEPDPTDKFKIMAYHRNNPDKYIRALTPTRFRKTSSMHLVVPSAISRFLAETRLRSQRSLRRLALTAQHHWNRLKWCRGQSSWLPSDWHRIVLNDEFNFTLVADDLHLRV